MYPTMANINSDSLSVGTENVSPPIVQGSSVMSKSRKRTKTGCLTCRKRRIKCGEERPTCGNCIKSKRQCEGYNQRVIFKPPIGDWPNHASGVSTIQYHTSMLPGARSQRSRAPEQLASTLCSSYTINQPRSSININSSSGDSFAVRSTQVGHQGRAGDRDGFRQSPIYQQPIHPPLHQQSLLSPHQPQQISKSATSYFSENSSTHLNASPQYKNEARDTYQESQTHNHDVPYAPVSVSCDNNINTKLETPSNHVQLEPSQKYSFDNQPDAADLYHSQSRPVPHGSGFAQNAAPRPVDRTLGVRLQEPIHTLQFTAGKTTHFEHHDYDTAAPHAELLHSNHSHVEMITHKSNADGVFAPQQFLEQHTTLSIIRTNRHQLLSSGFGRDDSGNSTQALDEAAIEKEDDDYWDVQSDDEMLDMELSDDNALLASSEFSNIRRIHNENFRELGIRRYDSFLYDGLLSHYRPEYAASPLRNPKTAQVFAHYIHVTGPALSLHERNSRNSALIFEGLAPHSQQGLWTYILPLKALAHQGLLHAMLALASLHIARLQGASITPSYKHYAYSLKRLVRSLGNPKTRLSVSTLATSMLLAFYEVWTAEHVKWSTHLVGAQILIAELDFRSLTRKARRLKAAQKAQEQQYPYRDSEVLTSQKRLDPRLNESILMPDESLVSTIVGNSVNYDEFGMVFEASSTQQNTKPNLSEDPTLRTFETLQDLYWSYARHDVFQSIISGNPLINPYRKWSDCPPRAPLGRADALYGSHDHVILLLGRIADFTVRDRERKLRQIDIDGSWKPKPGMPGFDSMGPPPPMAQDQRVPLSTPVRPMEKPSHIKVSSPGWTGPPPPGSFPPEGLCQSPPEKPTYAMPNFYGMAPSHPPAPIPPSYHNPNYKRSPKTPEDTPPKFDDLAAAYAEAIENWNKIAAAHATVTQILTNAECFAPLPSELSPPIPGKSDSSDMTPFGPALIHRSYDISIIWTLLYLAQILLLRSHPAMPPAAQMAASICAPVTQPYAMIIGRITAGMQIPLGEDLSPFLGAVLTESTLSLFFAGVQFQEPKQREWLITRLLEIDRRTGWASAGIIARGCETAWDKAAAIGRGPPYKRRTRRPGEEGPLILEDAGEEHWRRNEKDDYGKGAVVQEGLEYLNHGQDTRERQADANHVPGKDHRFVLKNRVLPWAKNLLGTEEDLRAGMERFGL